MYLVIFKDEQKMPRAWGAAELLSQAQERATWELYQYLEDYPSAVHRKFGKTAYLISADGRTKMRVGPQVPYSPSKRKLRGQYKPRPKTGSLTDG